MPNKKLFSRLFRRSENCGSKTRYFPYPVKVVPRKLDSEEIPPGGGTETFDQEESLAINEARMKHLASLDLSLAGKRVLDVGCSVGHLAQFFVKRDCKIVCVDARPENIASLRQRYSGLEAHVVNVETDNLGQFGEFDIVFSYGLLYHLENPLAGLRNMASVCRELLLLETLVCDHKLPVLRLDDETLAFSQALRGLGCRPSVSYVVLALNRIGFDYIYGPTVPPEHQDFQLQWKNNLDITREGHPIRCIFIASRKKLHNPNLASLL